MRKTKSLGALVGVGVVTVGTEEYDLAISGGRATMVVGGKREDSTGAVLFESTFAGTLWI